MNLNNSAKIAVVIPSYRVVRHILGVINSVPSLVNTIYVVDDGCPDGSGDYVSEHCKDPRVQVLRNAKNALVWQCCAVIYGQALNRLLGFV